MPYRPGDFTYELEGKIEFETEKAYLVVPTLGPPQIWIPKSQIANKTEKDPEGNVIFTVTQWWAENSDMADYI